MRVDQFHARPNGSLSFLLQEPFSLGEHSPITVQSKHCCSEHKALVHETGCLPHHQQDPEARPPHNGITSEHGEKGDTCWFR